MHKAYRYLLMLVLAVILSIPTIAAEAASVALLPLINNVQGDELANQVYYKSAINAINAQKGFLLVENDKLTEAIEKAQVGNKVPDKATLEKIAKNGDVDIVVAMELDVLTDNIVYDTNQDTLVLDLQGYAVAYNRITKKFYEHRIKDDKEIPAALASRWDWTHDEWGRNVKREMNRILDVKKVQFDAPRMSKL